MPPGNLLNLSVFQDLLLGCIVKLFCVCVCRCVAPPGCPPLQGSEGGQQQNFVGVLETAMKIANQDADAEDEEENGPTEAAKVKIKKWGLPNCYCVARESDCLWTKLRNVLLCVMPDSVAGYPTSTVLSTGPSAYCITLCL